MMRLGELAAQRGDAAGAARWFELVMGVDLEFPGARERRARYDRPVRAGDAGATLLAPDARAGVGRYALLRELGRGGAGAVFLASDARLDRQVALKLYHPQARADRGARLRGEAQVAAAVASAHVVRVHALHESLGAIVMEYFPGGSLRARITQGNVTAGEARRWAHEVALGLAHIHAAGWVHRDLKPGNVLLRADGRAVLTDFGLARAVGHASRAMEGTAGYVAPEAQGPSAASPSHDVYAFGVMARELGLDRDGRLGPLVERCVSVDPSRRPRDGAELASLTR
ncbi:MAG: serine/threonine-protein kinase [Polyangiales bacterium]